MDDLIYDVQDLQYYLESVMEKCTDKKTVKKLSPLLASLISLESGMIDEHFKILDRFYDEEGVPLL